MQEKVYDVVEGQQILRRRWTTIWSQTCCDSWSTIKNHVLIHKTKKSDSTQFDCSTLYKDKELKQKYQSAIVERLSNKT
jgi:hypothetical protein